MMYIELKVANVTMTAHETKVSKVKIFVTRQDLPVIIKLHFQFKFKHMPEPYTDISLNVQ